MVFIRRVRTASGATAVQIAEYTGSRRQRIVAHVGSAHTDAELGVLMAKARELIDDDSQGRLDLGLEPVATRTPLVTAPEPVPVLFAAVPAPPAGPVSVARVTGTHSGVLFDALAEVYDRLGFGVVADEVFRDLVIARLVEPTSLADTARVLTEMGRSPASYSTMRRTLARARTGKFRDRIAQACFAHATAHGDVSLCLYDVTTLYFEAEKEDRLRKVGFSKERRVDPQVMVGLLVDRNGFPLEIGCYAGNKAEKHTIVPIIEQFQARHGVESFVVVADAGMLSADNLNKLDEARMRFIVGSRVTKAPIDLESHFRWHGET
ncbi:IS1634 family transposase, partial [Nocardia sp. NPDC059177]|uniref:IS1634 family transposase n=1 Tax=Nocardia sp. NPDC059177 TaxID=3346759 RepID=UPI00369C8DE9